ncbi:BlaI/MecI/CopY family transcriptional regulator [Anaerosporobacter faecicola]|uniref:BlaI/MecI/CopY family transcriptional regulator n=1 Tax=Anaerosporobacter faecicola TaxID=2718714 RepID=UPI001EE4FF97|nr:BlaI/MecI/CopY family transcriptional regulator [Anaerosporobacter faecicola]
MKKEEEIKVDLKEENMKLPDSELFIMQTLWKAEPPVGTGKIVELITQSKDWSRSTIQVLLARLEERGFLRMEKQGRLKYYSPLVKEEDYRFKETHSFVKHFYHNSYKKLIASLVQDQHLSDEDYDELLTIIQQAKERE